jgi:hypothetical protein
VCTPYQDQQCTNTTVTSCNIVNEEKCEIQYDTHLEQQCDVRTGMCDVRTGMRDVRTGMCDVRTGMCDVRTGMGVASGQVCVTSGRYV